MTTSKIGGIQTPLWGGQRPALSRFVPFCPALSRSKNVPFKKMGDKAGHFYFIDLVNNNLSFYKFKHASSRLQKPTHLLIALDMKAKNLP